MTIQTNPGGPQLLLILTIVTALAIGGWTAIRALRGRPIGRFVAFLSVLLVLYAFALVAAGATSGTTNLRPGDAKCFDDWCAVMLTSATGSAPGSVEVQVRIENRGLRAQRSVLARAFVEAGGERIGPRNPDDLQALVPPGGSLDVRLLFAIPPQLAPSRFVVTEAASGELTPGVIVIGDESSPFHSIAGWPLRGAD